jgi:hydroxypyruvate isomerase
MPRFAANLSTLFAEHPFLDRFGAAARAGFRAVECQLPYSFVRHTLRARLEEHGLTQVLINMPAGDWAAGERGIACHPDRREEFAEGIDRAIDYARTLGCLQVNCLAGILPSGVSPVAARETFVENLALAAPRFAAHGIRLLIEPINTRDVPGFFLAHTAQAIDIVSEVQSDNLFLQFDVYHMQIMEGDLTRTLERHASHIGHVQIADAPDRHEPGTGEINYDFLLRRLDEVGYRGWVGLEYNPAGRTADGLKWLARAGWPLSPHVPSP